MADTQAWQGCLGPRSTAPHHLQDGREDPVSVATLTISVIAIGIVAVIALGVLRAKR